MYTKIRTKEKELVNQAAEWRLISLLFEYPKNNWKKQIMDLAEEIEDKDLKLAAKLAQTEATEGLYHSILGPGGPAPAREVSYNEWCQPGYLLSELAGYYKAFSYTPNTNEVSDHISVETAFISYLRLKEAYAIICEDEEKAKITVDASEKFINDHLNTMVEPLANFLADLGVDYLDKAAQALLKRVGASRHKKLPVFDTAFQEDGCEFNCE